MKYKGKDIGDTPTYDMIYECVENMGFDIDVDKMYRKYSDRNWMTKKGKRIKSVEAIVGAENGVLNQKNNKQHIDKPKRKKTIKLIPDPPKRDITKSPKENYEIFLKSEYWKRVRIMKIEQSGGKCQICGSRKCLNVHHNSYEHHYKEHKHLEDLVVLCRKCHEKFHDIVK